MKGDDAFLKAKKEYEYQSKLLYERYKKEFYKTKNKKELISSMPNSVAKSVLIDCLIQLNKESK